jgi:hypothetical protein
MSMEVIDLPKLLGLLIDESFSVGNNVLVVQAREDANLIDRIFLIFFAHRQNLDLLHCVQLIVLHALHQKDLTVTAAAQTLNYFEILEVGSLGLVVEGARIRERSPF